MATEAPVDMKVTSYLRPNGPACDFHPLDKQCKAPARGPHTPRRALNTSKTWAYLFPVLAVVLVLVVCIRTIQLSPSTARAGRSLAGRETEEDREQSAVLDMCLDLQEETGRAIHPAPPLPGPGKAIPLILESLLKNPSMAVSQRREGCEQSCSASEEKAVEPLALTYPNPGPSQYATWALHQGDEGSSLEPAVSCQIHKTPLAGISAALMQRPFSWTSVSTELHPPRSAQKRKGTDSAQGASGEAPPKKHTSGRKRRKPASTARAFLPAADQRPQGADDENAKGVPEVTERRGNAPQVMEDKGGDLLSKALEALPESPHVPSLESSLLQEAPVEGTEETPQSVAFSNSPVPSTSLGLGSTSLAPFRGNLCGLSQLAPTETFAAASASADNLAGGVQAAPPAPLVASARQLPPGAHPFYWVPLLQSGPIGRRFDAAGAFSRSYKRAHSFCPLAAVRALLNQPEISPTDATRLVEQSESLVGGLVNELQHPLNPRKLSRVVGRLGRAFLLLDAIISVIEVVGQAMNAAEWWPRLAALIPAQAFYSAKPRAGAEAMANAKLATRLSAALQVLKTGIRLSEEETVNLKRALLCEHPYVARFRHERWEPWRDDDTSKQE